MPTLPNQIYAGKLEDFEESMAKEIEDALIGLIGPLPAVPPKFVEDRRKLFIAIATGVINHLRDHHDALQVRVDPVSGTGTTTNINVRT